MNSHEEFEWTPERKGILAFVGIVAIFSVAATAWFAINGYHVQFANWYKNQTIQTQLLVMILLVLGLIYFGGSD